MGREKKKIYVNIEFNPEWISGFLFRGNDDFRSFKTTLTSDVHDAIEGVSPYVMVVSVTKMFMSGDSRRPWACHVEAGMFRPMLKGARAIAVRKKAVMAIEKTLSRWRGEPTRGFSWKGC